MEKKKYTIKYNEIAQDANDETKGLNLLYQRIQDKNKASDKKTSVKASNNGDFHSSPHI